jgi:hypothetical protein
LLIAYVGCSIKRVTFLIICGLLILSCKPEHPKPIVDSQESQGYDDYYYSAECYESQEHEFVGEYAYFKGVITDTTNTENLDPYRVYNNQIMSSYYHLDSSGAYLLSLNLKLLK